jgi:hypothetical protein
MDDVMFVGSINNKQIPLVFAELVTLIKSASTTSVAIAEFY